MFVEINQMEIEYPNKNQRAVTKSLVSVLESIDVDHTIIAGKVVVDQTQMDESDIQILNGLAEQINLTIEILKTSNDE